MKKYLVLLFLSCIGTGCALVRTPRTELKAGPFGSYFSFFDSKDNDIVIKNAIYDSSTNSFSVEEMTVRNNASDVSRAYAEQIKAQAEFTKAFAENMKAMASIVAAVVPGIAPIQGIPPTPSVIVEVVPEVSLPPLEESVTEVVGEVPE